MAANQATVNIPATALTAATAKTIVGVKAATYQAIKVLRLELSFDGATSSAVPVTVEFGRCTFGANPPGTNSTSATPVKEDPGRDETIQTTAAVNWTTEPTTITVESTRYVSAYNGNYGVLVPFAIPKIVAGGAGYVIRCTAPANVNVSGSLSFEE